MDIMTTIFSFIFGLALLLVGSIGVIKSALIISRLTKISPLVIGITAVAIGTSLPEIVVSFFGGLEKASDLSLGNIIGSNIANIGFILGISLLIKPIYIGRTKTQKNMLVALALSLFLFVTLLIDGLNVVHGIIFIVLGIVFTAWLVTQGNKEELPKKLASTQITISPFFTIVIFVLCLAALLIGGKFLVDASIEISKLLKVSEEIIGITALALGTSLPELSVSIVGLTRGMSRQEEKLIIGNILGSNIFNIFFGAGTLGLFGVKHFDDSFSLYAFLLFTLIFCFLIYIFKGKTIPRYFGGILITVYILYLAAIFKGV